jgi:hypothetical protein
MAISAKALKHRDKQIAVLDIVATTIAAQRYQQALCDNTVGLKPVDVSEYKPTQGAYLSYVVDGPSTDYGHLDFDEDNPECKTLCLLALSEYVKKTLNVGYPSDDAVEVEVTDADREAAQTALDTVTNRILMQTLKGVKSNSFITNMISAMDRVNVTHKDIGLLVYVARTAKQMAAREVVEVTKSTFMNSRPLVGGTNSKHELNVTILVKRYIASWDKFEIECNDEAGNLIKFYKEEKHVIGIEVDDTISIKGKLKVAEASPYSGNAIVNTLYYVKIAK